MTKRHVARFRRNGPTYVVGTYDTKAEAEAAVAGAKRVLVKLEDQLKATELPELPAPEPEKRTPAFSIPSAIRGGRLDHLLLGILTAALERKKFLDQLPKQHGLGVMAGMDESAIRQRAYGGTDEARKKKLGEMTYAELKADRASR